MKPGKHQRNKQRCQDLCWKVHDPAESFVLRSYTVYELLNKKFLLVSSSERNKPLLFYVDGQGQKENKKHATQNFSGFITLY